MIEGFLQATDGTRLFYRRWDAQRPKAACLLAHGVAEHSGRYAPLARDLTARGFSVYALDLRGHGRSGGRPTDCTGANQLVEDLRALNRTAAENGPTLPRILIGHSLGGLLALTYAARYGGELRAVAVSSPALKLAHETPAWKVRLVTGTARFFPFFPFQNGVNPQVLSHDPAVVRAYREDPLIHRTLTARCAVLIDRDMKISLRLAEQIRIPCLILQAGADEVCDRNTSEAFSRAVRSAPMTFRVYEGLYHELFNEPQRDRVIDDLVRWMEQVLA